MAWQYHDPEAQAGAVQALRRQECSEDSFECQLRGQTPGMVYTITYRDTREAFDVVAVASGSAPIVVTLDDALPAAILTYRAQK